MPRPEAGNMPASPGTTLRRLDFEQLRDAMLAVTGELDSSVGGSPSDLLAADNRRRTVYAFVDRQFLPGALRTFDFANPDIHVAVRHETTVPQQALFFLNGTFAAERARALASRVGALETPGAAGSRTAPEPLPARAFGQGVGTRIAVCRSGRSGRGRRWKRPSRLRGSTARGKWTNRGAPEAFHALAPFHRSGLAGARILAGRHVGMGSIDRRRRASRQHPRPCVCPPVGGSRRGCGAHRGPASP